MIDFSRAFASAWQRMTIILFQPFDLGKWLTIGLSAFLAGLLSGGNGLNGSGSNPMSNLSKPWTSSGQFDVHHLKTQLVQAFSGFQGGLIMIVGLAIFILVLGVILIVYWLGARGQFLFLDNIVRNRGSISVPWSRYAREADRLFGFYVVLILASLLLFLPLLALGIYLGLPLFEEERWPDFNEILGFAFLGMIYFVVALFLNFIIFIFRELGVPLMFRNGLTARAALRETLRLLQRHPASMLVFVLIRIGLFLGVAVLSLVTCCLCCIGIIPYVGTVVLLPALVFVRCFTLDCLAQFGPEYDIWTVDVPGTPLTPPPPPG